MGSVTAQGYLKTQLLLQKDGHTGHLEELSPSLQNNAWSGRTGDAWERGPYHVRGLVALAYTLDDADLKAQAQKWIDWTLASQRENGAFGPSGTDLWARILMLQAVRDYGETTGDPRVMPFFDRFLRYELKTLLKTPVDPDSWAAQRIGDNVDIALWYYNKTKANFALDLILLLYWQGTDWESVYRTGDFKRTPMITHIVDQQQSFKLLPLAYLAGCGDHLKEIYAQGVSTVRTTATNICAIIPPRPAEKRAPSWSGCCRTRARCARSAMPPSPTGWSGSRSTPCPPRPTRTSRHRRISL